MCCMQLESLKSCNLCTHRSNWACNGGIVTQLWIINQLNQTKAALWPLRAARWSAAWYLRINHGPNSPILLCGPHQQLPTIPTRPGEKRGAAPPPGTLHLDNGVGPKRLAHQQLHTSGRGNSLGENDGRRRDWKEDATPTDTTHSTSAGGAAAPWHLLKDSVPSN